MTEPSPAPRANVDGIAIAALVIGVISVFFNPFVVVSVLAIVLGIVALTRKNRPYRLIAILGIVAGAVGAILVIVGNTISSLS